MERKAQAACKSFLGKELLCPRRRWIYYFGDREMRAVAMKEERVWVK